MGLFKTLRNLGRHLRTSRPAPNSVKPRKARNCRIEKMEDRQYLSAVPPIQVGAVYHEDNNGDDVVGDQIAITWSGGAAGTQLTHLEIDTDKAGDGLSIADVFFDTQSGGRGAFGAVAFSIVSQQGIGPVSYSVADGGTLLTLDIQGWDAGEKLVISIDVDEMGSRTANAVAEGNEFEDSHFSVVFASAAYYDAPGSDAFEDAYDYKLGPTGLDLPRDNYMPPYSADDAVYTAAACVSLTQNPKPSSLAGTVYDDPNKTNTQQSGEPGIGGVNLELFRLDGGAYATTGRTTQTDADGHYRFDNLAPDTYQVRETQPSGYLSVGATAGNVAGQQRGAVENVNQLTGIALGPNENSVSNDFAEIKPARLSGYVYHDRNNNGLMEAGESPIAGAEIRVQQLPADGSTPAYISILTKADGSWASGDLMPDNYRVTEEQPSGWRDGLDAAGTAGGTAVNPGDRINGVTLAAAQSGVHYDFGELLPASISGRVHLDTDGNNVGELLLQGVTIRLLDAQGGLLATKTTDANGQYAFTDLLPGQYAVQEAQPTLYYDGDSYVGSAGGTHASTNDLTDVVLLSGVSAIRYDFYELAPASIAGRVHAELNQDAEHNVDEGEPLLAGVTIYLLDSAGLRIAETQTDGQGYYKFSQLPPGVYSVEEVQPTEYLDYDSHVGSAGGSIGDSNLILDATLAAGASAVNYDFCELVPASLSGYVFQDGPTIRVAWNAPDPSIKEVRDGQLTSDDRRLAGVTLQLGGPHGEPLTDDNGDPILATTDANGYYEFTRLKPGTYTVIEYQPDGYRNGVNSVGSNGGTSVNENDAISPLVYEQLDEAVKDNDGIILIPIRPGDQAVTYNFGEVVLERNPPPPYSPPLPPEPPFPGPPTPSGSPVEINRLQTYALPSVVSPVVFLAGAAAPVTHTWHLSVLNGGQPRRELADSANGQTAQYRVFNQTAWAGMNMNQGTWTVYNSKGKAVRKVVFGLHGAAPIGGDWNGDGKMELGMYLNGEWFLDLNGDGVWDAGDLWAQLGHEGDRPVTGDWDGDGKTDIGIFGPAWAGDERALAREPGQPDPQNAQTGRYKNIPPRPEEATDGYRALRLTSRGKVRTDLIDHVFRFGVPGDVPLAGDWNGDGVTTVGVFRDGMWYLDVNGDGRFESNDLVFKFGNPGDIPLTGDWVGDGVTRVGVYRHGQVYLDIQGNHQLNEKVTPLEVGAPGDTPVAGDFDGDGVDEVAVYHAGAEGAASSQAALPAASGGDAVR